jgi:hypothetical protein
MAIKLTQVEGMGSHAGSLHPLALAEEDILSRGLAYVRRLTGQVRSRRSLNVMQLGIAFSQHRSDIRRALESYIL